MKLPSILCWTALITPMFEDGSIDFSSLTYCVEQQQAAGNGIVLAGSTGEGLALTMQEQQAVVRIQHMQLLQLIIRKQQHSIILQQHFVKMFPIQSQHSAVAVLPENLVPQAHWFL